MCVCVYWLRPGPVRDFGTEQALAEPLGPNTTNFPNSSPYFTLVTELNPTVPKARPEAHAFDFTGQTSLQQAWGGATENHLVCGVMPPAAGGIPQTPSTKGRGV